MTYKLINKDCIEWMNSQEEESIDCIITSPPYNLDIKYGQYKDDIPRDGYLKWIGDVSVAIKRVLKLNGHLFMNVGYSNIDPWVAMDVAQSVRKHLILQNNFTWVKHMLLNDQSYGQYKPIASNRYVSATTESIFHFTKTGAAPINRLSIGHRNATHEKWPELYSESRHIANHRRSACKKLGFDTWIKFQKDHTPEQKIQFDLLMDAAEKKKPWNPDSKKCIGNAWFIPYTPTSKLAKEVGEDSLGNRESGKGNHPATFPEQLPDMCIKLSGIPKGSKVYDPFNGTGTTILSALKLGMEGIGTDIDQSYLDFAEKRIEYFLNPPVVETASKKSKKTLDPVFFEQVNE